MTALSALTVFHTALSFVALILGLPVAAALMAGRNPEKLVAWFLATAAITTLTGFFFPFHGFTPAMGVGIVSGIVIVVDLVARFGASRRRGWRHVDTLALLFTEYFLVFVAIAQAFLKVTALHAIAPTGTEGPFKLAQGLLFLALVVVAIISLRARPGMHRATLRPAR